MPNDMFDLSGKMAIVTGGNGGIGLGIAKGLAQAGASIVVAARNQSKTRDAIRQIEALGVAALGHATDVSDETSVASMVAAAVSEFGRVDILVNNAGTVVRKLPQDHSLEEWNEVIDVNLTGGFLCSREVYPHMSRVGGGKIINIGSVTSVFGTDWIVAYSSSKGGVVQLTKSLAIAWARDNIQVNAMLPGWVKTDLTATIEERSPDRYNLISSRIPIGRWADPEDMGGAAVFLASRASDYVTGVALPVDGGYIAF